MRQEIKYFVYMIALGMGLVAYAHGTFIDKYSFGLMYDDIKEMKTDIRYMREHNE